MTFPFQRNELRPVRVLPSGTLPICLIRGTVRPSSLRLPVTRTTKIPIVWILVVVDTTGLSGTFVIVVCSELRQLLVQVTVGMSSALASAIDRPPQLDWNARVCGVGASGPMSIAGLTIVCRPGVRSKIGSVRRPSAVVRTKAS